MGFTVSRRQGLASVCALIGAVYFLGLAPSVSGGDSGELVTVGATLGIAHPPGYPLYTLLAKLFSLIPFGTVAWRVNLFSAVCAVGAAALLYQIVLRLTDDVVAAALAAILFAFSPSVWKCAEVAEVFALNNFFCALMLFLFLRFRESGEEKFVLWGAFALGLSLSNHHLSAFYGLVLVVGTFLSVEKGRGELFAKTAASFALGLLPYLYIPLRAASHPEVAWGEPSTLSGFITHLLRAEYGTFRLHAGSLSESFPFLRTIYQYGSHAVLSSLGLVILPLLFLFRRKSSLDRDFLRVTVAGFAFYVLVFSALSNPVPQALFRNLHARFWQQPDLILFLWIGLAFSVIPWPRRIAAPVVRAIVLVLAVGLQIGLHWAEASRRGDWILRNYAGDVLNRVPTGGLLLLSGDATVGSVFYAQKVEQVRPDVGTLPFAFLGRPWTNSWISRHRPQWGETGSLPTPDVDFSTSFNGLIERQLSRRSVYGADAQPLDRHLAAKVGIWPAGCAFELGEKQPTRERLLGVVSRFSECPALTEVTYPRGTWEKDLQEGFWIARRNLINRVLALDTREALDVGLKLVQYVIAHDPMAEPVLHQSVKEIRARMELLKH